MSKIAFAVFEHRKTQIQMKIFKTELDMIEEKNNL